MKISTLSVICRQIEIASVKYVSFCDNHCLEQISCKESFTAEQVSLYIGLSVFSNHQYTNRGHLVIVSGHDRALGIMIEIMIRTKY